MPDFQSGQDDAYSRRVNELRSIDAAVQAGKISQSQAQTQIAQSGMSEKTEIGQMEGAAIRPNSVVYNAQTGKTTMVAAETGFSPAMISPATPTTDYFQAAVQAKIGQPKGILQEAMQKGVEAKKAVVKIVSPTNVVSVGSDKKSFSPAFLQARKEEYSIAGLPEERQEIELQQKGLQELAGLQRVSSGFVTEDVAKANAIYSKPLAILGLKPSDLAGKSPIVVQRLVQSKMTLENVDKYNAAVLFAEKQAEPLLEKIKKGSVFSESLGKNVESSNKLLNLKIEKYNVFLEKPVSAILPDTSKNVLMPFAKTTSGILDIGSGIGSATIASVVGGDTRKAFETGVALRRPLVYGATLLPVVGEAVSPLVAVTALSDFGVKPNLENAIIGGAFVTGFSSLKAVPAVGTFLMAGKTSKVLSSVGKGTGIAEKVLSPALGVVGAAYLEESTFGVGAKALGIKTTTIMGEVSKGKYSSARSLELEQGSQFGSFIVGGGTAQLGVKGFQATPRVVSEMKIIETAPESIPIGPKKSSGGFFQLGESITGSVKTNAVATVSAEYKIPFTEKAIGLPLKKLPAVFSGENVSVSTFSSKTAFGQKVVSKGEFSSKLGKMPTEDVFLKGNFDIKKIGAKTIEAKVSTPEFSAESFSSKKTSTLVGSEEKGLKIVDSFEKDVVVGSYESGKGERSFVRKEDVIPAMTKYSSIVKETGSTVSFEEGLLNSKILSGKKRFALNQETNAFRVSRTKAIIPTEELGFSKAGEKTELFGERLGEKKPMKPLSFGKTENIVLQPSKGGTVTGQKTVLELTPEMRSATKIDVSGITGKAIQSQKPRTVSFAAVSQQTFNGSGYVQSQRNQTVSVVQQKGLSFPKSFGVSKTFSETFEEPVSKSQSFSFTRNGMAQVLQTKPLTGFTIAKPFEIVGTKPISIAKTQPLAGSILKTATRTATVTRTTTLTVTKPFLGYGTILIGKPKPSTGFGFYPKTPPSTEPSAGRFRPLGEKGGLSFSRSRSLLKVQSSPLRRVLYGESNVATTRKTLGAYYRALSSGAGGALTSFVTAQELRGILKRRRKRI